MYALCFHTGKYAVCQHPPFASLKEKGPRLRQQPGQYTLQILQNRRKLDEHQNEQRLSIRTSCGSLFARRKNHSSYSAGLPHRGPITPLPKTQLHEKWEKTAQLKYITEKSGISKQKTVVTQTNKNTSNLFTSRNGFAPNDIK